MRRLIAAILLLAGAACSRGGDVAHGAHLGTVMGCTSCHGHALDGHLFEENRAMALAWSSNLSRILPAWSDAQIERVLRTGRRPDGSELWFMPSFVHTRLSPDDMRDLIAWLRTVPPTGTLHPAIVWGPQGNAMRAAGWPSSAAYVEKLRTRVPPDLGPATAHGRYLTQLACAECHGPDLKGPKGPQPGDPPDLAIAAAYTPAQFARLLTTGIAASGKAAAGEMASEAPKRLAALTAAEREAIRGYLVARAR